MISSLKVGNGGAKADFALRRDWASVGGGGAVSAFSGPDYTPYGCGPGSAIDQSLGNGWGSTSDDDGATGGWAPTPKYVVVKLPQAVNVSQLAVDPGNTCGDAGSASTKDYTVETSSDGSSWSLAGSGSFTAADRHRLNLITPAAGSAAGVQFVRFTMINPQVPGDFATQCAAGGYSGCAFMDMSELEVYGAPVAP